MINWLRTLKLKDLLGDEEDAAAVQKAASGMYERLEAFRLKYYPHDPDLWDITEEFETLRDDPDADNVWFNNLMANLYDWGDRGHRLWIE